jgi:carboxyl-terminal processing protease
MKFLSTSFRALFAVSVLVFSASAFAQADPPADEGPTEEVRTEILKAFEQILTQTAFVPGVNFSVWPEMVAKQSAALSEAKTHDEFSLAINGALEEFGFSHVALYPPEFGRQRTSGTRAGFGIRVQIEDGGLRVVKVFPESPASKADIQQGDLVVESDGHEVRSVSHLRGNKGETSTITVVRGEERIELTITRDDYNTVLPETLTWREKVAVIEVPTFDIGYNPSHIDDLMTEAMDAEMIVLDLRSNGGGRVTSLQHLMGWFLDRSEEPLGTFVGRATVNRYLRDTGSEEIDLVAVADHARAKVRARARDGEVYKGQIAVLMSGATGSASEMAAAALQHYRGAALIGSESAGAVLASMMIPLPGGHDYWVQFPVTDYVTISGARLEGNGLKPDMYAQIPLFGEQDLAVAKAERWLALVKQFSDPPSVTASGR